MPQAKISGRFCNFRILEMGTSLKYLYSVTSPGQVWEGRGEIPLPEPIVCYFIKQQLSDKNSKKEIYML